MTFLLLPQLNQHFLKATRLLPLSVVDALVLSVYMYTHKTEVFICFLFTLGPTRRFRRVCEKLEAAIVNPSTVNPLVHEMADFGINPSLSSDDTLAANEGEEPAISEQNGERSHGAPRELLESYDSTEDESEEAQTSILY